MLVPFKLSDHLVHYFFRELKGQSKKYGGREVKVIPIEKSSFIGKIVISALVKIDYPIKDIREFNLFLEMSDVKRVKYCNKQKLFKKEDLENSFVQVPTEFMNDINGMLDDIFRQNFFHYVYGSVKNDDSKVLPTVRQFMDEYELWNLNFDIDQLRQIYYRMKKEGPGVWLQNKDNANLRSAKSI